MGSTGWKERPPSLIIQSLRSYTSCPSTKYFTKAVDHKPAIQSRFNLRAYDDHHIACRGRSTCERRLRLSNFTVSFIKAGNISNINMENVEDILFAASFSMTCSVALCRSSIACWWASSAHIARGELSRKIQLTASPGAMRHVRPELTARRFGQYTYRGRWDYGLECPWFAGCCHRWHCVPATR